MNFGAMAFIELATLPTKELIPGYTARAVHTGELSLLFWNVEAGAAVPMHSHPHEQVAHVMSGEFEMTVAGETTILRPGIIAVIPPHTLHGGKAVTPCSLLDVFRPERDDYKWEK